MKPSFFSFKILLLFKYMVVLLSFFSKRTSFMEIDTHGSVIPWSSSIGLYMLSAGDDLEENFLQYS